MNNTDRQFKELIEKILLEGHSCKNRTGIDSKSIFGYQMRFKMDEGFPLLTLRKIHVKSAIHELLWFLGAFEEKWDRFGNTNVRYLNDMGVNFWQEWPYKHYCEQREFCPELPPFTIQQFEEKIKIDNKFAVDFGSIGPGYGKQWTNYGGGVERTRDDKGNSSIKVIQGINQIDECIELLKNDPDSRRIIVDSWNVEDLKDMLLPPCHLLFQFKSYKMEPKERVIEYKKLFPNNTGTMDQNNFPDRKLSVQMYQRSVDVGLGISYNIAEYALLLHMVSQVVNMIPYEFIWVGGDTHIYNNHMKQVKEIISRESYSLPTLKLNKNIESIYDFRYDDIIIENYKSHPNIKMDVAV